MKKRRLKKEHFKRNTVQESMDISECIRADLLVFLSTVFKSIKRWLWREEDKLYKNVTKGKNAISYICEF